MSISSAFYASYAERKRSEWASALADAVAKQDWEAVREVLAKIEAHRFEE